jgi:uncharacterized protein with HEPN domain
MNPIRDYLLDLLKSITRIEAYTREGATAFFADEKTQDAVTRNFEIIGEVVKRIPREFLNQRPEVPWQDVAGFRDVLIHDYDVVDLDEVWLVVERDLPILRMAVEALLAKLSAESDEV